MGKRLSATATEQLRRELAASLFFAMPRRDATDRERIEAYQRRVRPLLHCLDIIEGTAEPETETCEGCSVTLKPEDPRHNCQDGEVLCAECTPEGYSAEAYGYLAKDADADIYAARLFAKEMAL